MLAPGDDLVEAHAGLHALHHMLHQQAQAAGDAQGVHHIELPLRVFGADLLGRLVGVDEGDGHLLGHVQEDQVLAGVQQALEKVVVHELVDHGGFQPVALAHAGVDRLPALLPAVVLKELVPHGVGVGDKGDPVGVEPGEG